jgi:hypothetical protein
LAKLLGRSDHAQLLQQTQVMAPVLERAEMAADTPQDGSGGSRMLGSGLVMVDSGA